MCVEIKQHDDSSSGGSGVNWFGAMGKWNNNNKEDDVDGALDAERVVERARVRAGKRDGSKANQSSRTAVQRSPYQSSPLAATTRTLPRRRRPIPFRSGRSRRAAAAPFATRGKRITSLLLTSPRDIAEENKDINTNPDVRRHIMGYTDNRFGRFAATADAVGPRAPTSFPSHPSPLPTP